MARRDCKNFWKAGTLGPASCFAGVRGLQVRKSFMARRPGRPPRARAHRDPRDRMSELEELLSPEAAFSGSFEVVAHPGPGVAGKRAILVPLPARICCDLAG